MVQQSRHVCLRATLLNLCVLMVLVMMYSMNFTPTPLLRFISPKVAVDRSLVESSFCDETFNQSFNDNLDVIKHYPRGHADEYLYKIGGNMTKPKKVTRFPVFVTAIDVRYYSQSKGLFKSLHQRFLEHPKYKDDMHIIVYDLGLSKAQLNTLKSKCRCEIRPFRFDQFPEHVGTLSSYAFKPIIVQEMLMEFGFVWWVDSSVRFTTSNIDRVIDYAIRYSVFYTVTTSNRRTFSMTQQTNTRTFQFLREDPCKFQPYSEIWATTALFHSDNVSDVVVRAWATCALNMQCIAPLNSEIFCDPMDTRDGRCHRYDQSMLGILMRRLYHEQNTYPKDTSLNDVYVIMRGDLVHYF